MTVQNLIMHLTLVTELADQFREICEMAAPNNITFIFYDNKESA